MSVCLAAVSMAACHSTVHRGDPNLQIRITVRPDHPRPGAARVMVSVRSIAWAPINGATVTVTASPPDSSGAPTTMHAPGDGAGTYVVPRFPFDRPGVWTLTAKVKTGRRRAEVERHVAVADSSSR